MSPEKRSTPYIVNQHIYIYSHVFQNTIYFKWIPIPVTRTSSEVLSLKTHSNLGGDRYLVHLITEKSNNKATLVQVITLIEMEELKIRLFLELSLSLTKSVFKNLLKVKTFFNNFWDNFKPIKMVKLSLNLISKNNTVKDCCVYNNKSMAWWGNL